MLFTTTSFAQSNLDSLFQLWQDNSQSDSIRAWAFYDFIREGPFYSDPDSALVLEEELIQFVKQTDLEMLMVDAIQLQGYTYFRMGNYADALASYREGMTVAEQYRDTIGMADLLRLTGFIYHDNENFVKALDYYERSRYLAEALEDTSGLSSIYNEFGSIHLTRGEYDIALEYYENALELYRQLNDGENSPAMLANIGILYLDKGNLEQALQYIELALQINKERNDKLSIATGLALIGEILLQKEEESQGLDSLKRSLQLSLAIEHIEGALNTLLVLGDHYLGKNQYQLANTYAEQSLDLARSLGDFGGQKSACKQLYLIYKSLNQNDIALKYHEEMLRFTDSIQAEGTSVKLQQMEFARQVMADSLAQVEKDLKMQQAHELEVRSKEMNRNIAIGVSLFFFILSAGLYSRWRYVKKSKAIIEKEKNRSEELLLNILPSETAEELKQYGAAEARTYDMVTIIFTDFKEFTQHSEKLSAKELVAEIDHCFKAFDRIIESHQVEKIKTIGDAYLAAAGLPVPNTSHPLDAIQAALAIRDFMLNYQRKRIAEGREAFEVRIGVHSGPVVAGIVGIKKFAYDIWGDTVNLASRMESSGEIGKVNISKSTYELLKNHPEFKFQSRGKIMAKNKGELEMYFVERAS